jgi:hypothetical protein
MCMPERHIVPHNEHYITAKELKELLAGVPDDVPVYYERIEDYYMEPGRGWTKNAVRVADSTDPLYSNDYHQAWGAWYDKEHKALFITAFY